MFDSRWGGLITAAYDETPSSASLLSAGDTSPTAEEGGKNGCMERGREGGRREGRVVTAKSFRSETM